jgi:hypothetical protein
MSFKQIRGYLVSFKEIASSFEQKLDHSKIFLAGSDVARGITVLQQEIMKEARFGSYP